MKVSKIIEKVGRDTYLVEVDFSPELVSIKTLTVWKQAEFKSLDNVKIIANPGEVFLLLSCDPKPEDKELLCRHIVTGLTGRIPRDHVMPSTPYGPATQQVPSE